MWLPPPNKPPAKPCRRPPDDSDRINATPQDQCDPLKDFCGAALAVSGAYRPIAVIGATLLWVGATYEARLRNLTKLRRSLANMH